MPNESEKLNGKTVNGGNGHAVEEGQRTLLILQPLAFSGNVKGLRITDRGKGKAVQYARSALMRY